MKAFILAAGLGTRLKPWTLTHPKALVPVAGVPMLERVIRRLESLGFDYIVVNIHHLGQQIIEFLNSRTWRASIYVSDERDMLLDTGGALLHASSLLCGDDSPFLVHNVDILSDAPLDELMQHHVKSRADATLLVNERESSRRLLFDNEMNLRGWKNLITGEVRGEVSDQFRSLAFSGIHVINPALIRDMSAEGLPKVFPIMDFYLSHTCKNILKGYCPVRPIKLIDIGKPDTLALANSLFG